MRIIVIVASLAFILTACTSERYDTRPDPSWQPRSYYCWFFLVDPRGDDNTNVGWADEEPVLQRSPGSVSIEAVSARVHTGLFEASDLGNDKKDYFRQYVIWTTDSNGSAHIERRC